MGEMAASPRVLLALLLALAALCLLPGGAGASDDDFVDPIGDMPMYAVDLGTTTVLDGGDTLSVETAMVPRPPAGWGGCAYSFGSACIPAEMSVTWFLDHVAGGNPADDGADVKVTVTPEEGLSFWTSERWSSSADRYLPGPRPLGSEAPESLRWSARLSDLGIEARPANVRIWVVSTFRSPPGIGTPLDLEDRAGPGTVVLGAPTASASPAGCDRRATVSRRPQRRLLRSGAARPRTARSNAGVAPGRALGPRRGCA